ncbi:MAG: ImmA/IrrE family metallo-endopeptidase, partial [Oscillospiraceae bacterium]|nr:ImmA/IrrE family metallo-endopeptidase [Oscillospiraceae bacterium]
GHQIDIEALAGEYLGLKQFYTQLSDDRTLLGLTTFSEIELSLNRNGKSETIRLPQDTILLEEAMLKDDKPGRRRFTIAHECGHQILCRAEEEQTGVSVRARFAPGQAYSCRDLQRVSNRYEWQANALAAVLLMPGDLIAYVMTLFCQGEKIKRFGYWGSERSDRICVNAMAEYIGVSASAFMIRLRELGYIENRPAKEFKYNPIDIYVTLEEAI